ncbi:MAG: PilT/PilU family type 4a pilus ATPase [Vampirovibrionales bacterium]|nr:PilT/PilU family type 4a pilus ATPase [Vampirovibrionales bacterium]
MSSLSPLSIAEDLETFLRMAVAQNISDVHLRCGYPPMLRKDGEMISTKLPPMDEDSMTAFAQRIIPPKVMDRVMSRRDFDFGYDLEDVARFRVNFFFELNRPGLVLRVIPLKIPKIEEIGLPSIITRFTEHHKGLVLLTGPTGAGKSTTLAALLNHINESTARHIITIEDPVEYVYHNMRSVITQREIGVDTDSFPSGLKYALRQDPDVILIGEMRDRETISSALHAAETGHLVFSTLHTTDAVQTINRIINIYEPHEREPVRHQLADVLIGTISQRLVRKKEGRGRVAVAEIMSVSPAVKDYIKREELGEIYQMLAAGEFDDMCNLNGSLFKATRNELIAQDEALRISDNPSELHQMFRGAYHGSGG